jgi:cell cycle sensor histidine kinase DivJ
LLSISALAFEERIRALVHPSVAQDDELRERHVRFLMSRLLAVAATLAAMPVYLALAGVPGLTESLAFACLVLPLAAVLMLSRTGRLDRAIGLSAFAMSGLVVILSLGTGGLKSPVIVWFIAIPLEAIFSGSVRSVRLTVAAASAGLIALAGCDLAGLAAATTPWSLHLAVPIMALSAISHVSAVGLALARADMAHRQSRVVRDARDEAILDAVGDLVTWHDSTGGVSFASQSAMRLLGVTPHELIGRGLFERVLVADRPAFLTSLSDAVRGIEAGATLLRLRTDVPMPDGQTGGHIWVEMKARRIVTSDARAVVVAVLRDVTQRKFHEDEIELARSEAVKANELKGRFLGTVSHELRTPLNAIIGFSEILGSDTMGVMDDERRREYARIIHSSGHHLLEVVNTLLDISKIETGNFDLNPEPFSAVSLAGSCCDLMQLKAEKAQIRLVRDWRHDLSDIVADRRALKQVLINLLSNAVKFTPERGVVTVSLRQTAERLELIVSDTGIGIAEQDLPRIGNPFFQARSTYDRPYEGTGLGLSVVRGIVSLHGGTFDVSSRQGLGTTVTVSLPIDCRLPAPSRITSLHREPSANIERAVSPMRLSA